MIKKNLIITFIAVIFFINSKAFAAYSTNSGHYLQLDAISLKSDNRLVVSEEYKTYDTTNNGGSYEDGVEYYLTDVRPSGSKIGFGISYRYAYSFEKVLVDPLKWIFISSGIFYENVNNSNSDEYSVLKTSVTYKNRRGVKFDLGYDFDYGIAPYITGGISGTDYSITSKIGSIDSFKRSGTSYAPFYGAGIYYSPFKKVSFMLEYTLQSSSINYHFSGAYETTGLPFNEVKNTLNIVKLGLAYHF